MRGGHKVLSSGLGASVTGRELFFFFIILLLVAPSQQPCSLLVSSQPLCIWPRGAHLALGHVHHRPRANSFNLKRHNNNNNNSKPNKTIELDEFTAITRTATTLRRPSPAWLWSGLLINTIVCPSKARSNS